MNSEHNIPWNDLLREAKEGQPGAQNALCRELVVSFRLIAQFRLWGWPRQELEDIVQEALCALLQKLNQVESNPQMYACEILRHKIGDALRRHKSTQMRHQPYSEEESHHQEAAVVPALHPEEDVDGFIAKLEARDRLALVKSAIRELPSFCRAFFLGILEGQSVQELWTFFHQLEPDLQRNAFDKRIFDCRKRLRRLVQDQL